MLESLTREPAPELGARVERWRMRTADEAMYTGLWCGPVDAGASTMRPAAWSVALLGGFGTDDRAALLMPDTLPVGVLALSWPWRGPRSMSRLGFLARVPALRRTVLEAPATLAAGVAALRRAAPDARVALLGASLGAPPAIAAVPEAHPDALVLVDAAADLPALFAVETRRLLGGGVSARLAAAPAGTIAGGLVGQLEPDRHAHASRALPVLVLDAAHEERYPARCVTRLHAAFPHATLARHDGAHIRPEDREQIAAIVRVASGWLEALPALSRAGEAAARDPGPRN
jgi:hypothetical protein